MEDMANRVMRELYRPKAIIYHYLKRPVREVQWSIAQAKKFVLDDSMSRFLAHLSTVPFIVNEERRPDVLNSLRCSARLPHPQVWIQIDGRAFRKGLLEQSNVNTRDIFGKPLTDDTDVIATPSLLLEQVGEEHIRMTYFADVDVYDQFNNKRTSLVTLPFVYHYKTDVSGLPAYFDFLGGMLSHGIQGFLTTEIGIEHHFPIKKDDRLLMAFDEIEKVNEGSIGDLEKYVNSGELVTHKLVAELGGILRYIMAFLATLNDIPALRTEIKPAKGYMARGRYRKYMDHTVMTLTLPRKTTMIKLAQRLIAMTRKRWHTVSPHWRVNKRPKGFVCEPSYKHIWTPRDDSGHSYCQICEARRVWIVLPNGRGDPTLGVVHHQEVQVTHAV